MTVSQIPLDPNRVCSVFPKGTDSLQAMRDVSIVWSQADVFFLLLLPVSWLLPQSFERVLVENKLHGLSPALSEAIQSISRWELVQTALPHVLHCTSILLSNRNKLGKDT